jgi:hypothetical protein
MCSSPTGFGGLGDAEQQRDHGDAPAPLKLARDR